MMPFGRPGVTQGIFQLFHEQYYSALFAVEGAF